MTAPALLALSPARESASEHARNALQVLMKPDDQIDELDLAAVRDRLAKIIEAVEVEHSAYITAIELIREQAGEREGLRQENEDLREFADELTSLGLHIHVDYERREFTLSRRFERPVLTTSDWQLLTTTVRELQKLEKTLTRSAAGAARGD